MQQAYSQKNKSLIIPNISLMYALHGNRGQNIFIIRVYTMESKWSELQLLGKRLVAATIAVLMPQYITNALYYSSRLFTKHSQYIHPPPMGILSTSVVHKSLNFALYNHLKPSNPSIDRDSSLPTYAQYFALGGLIGLINLSIFYPINYHRILHVNDMIKSDQMKQRGESKMGIFKFIVQNRYKGFVVNALLAFTFHSIYFGLYDIQKHKYALNNCIPNEADKLNFSIVATLTATITSMPFHVLRQARARKGIGIDFSLKQLMQISIKRIFPVNRMISLANLYFFDKLQTLFHIVQ